MSHHVRSPLQQEVVQALIETKAIDFTAVSATLSKYGERAALTGDDLVQIIGRKVMWACGWPGPELDVVGGRLVRELSE